MSFRKLFGAIVLFTAAVPLHAWAQAGRAGSEFQVNTYTTQAQYAPAVAADATGGFVVVWASPPDGSSPGIFGQRYDGSGAAVGGEFQVNSYTTSYQYSPAVAADPMGGFVVVWASSNQDAPFGPGVFGQRYDSSGATVGGEFQVNSYTTNQQYEPEVTVDSTGSFLVVWTSVGQVAFNSRDVFGQRYDSSGAALGTEFQVNTNTNGDQQHPRVATTSSDGFVVVWQGPGDGSAVGVFGQRYDSSGATLGGEFQANTYFTSGQYDPAVGADTAGGFVVVWASSGQDGSGRGIFGQRYDSSGATLGSEFQVNAFATGEQYHAHVVGDSSGGFVVVWDWRGAGDSYGVVGKRYDSSGMAIGTEFQVNTYTTSEQYIGRVDAGPSGSFVVVWQSEGQDGSNDGVFAQRFCAIATCTDGDGCCPAACNSGNDDDCPAPPTTSTSTITTTTSTITTTTTTTTIPPALILGKKILVKDTAGTEDKRKVIALGVERTTDIGPSIVGDPVTNGATLRIVVNGGDDSDQTYVLDAAGWQPMGTIGFKYSGPTAADGDPVSKVLLKRTSSGTALLKVLVKGNVGTQALDVVPPNLGDSGGLILSINGGSTYCVSFGGAAGGTEVRDLPTLWKMVNPTAQPGCVTP